MGLISPEFQQKSAITAQWLIFASSVAIIIGIAPSQILLGASILALLISGKKWEGPSVWVPLSFFLGWTLLALIFSEDLLAGMPQLKKMYVFSQLFVAFTLLRQTKFCRWLVISWGVVGSIAAAFSVYQYILKMKSLEDSSQEAYTGYVAERITGFMSHWYTFSVEQMIVFLMLVAFVLFSPLTGRYRWLWATLSTLIGVSIVLAQTRAVWVAGVVGLTYLVFSWKRSITFAIPVLMLAGFFVSPPVIRERIVSIFSPSAADSNEFRVILMKTGVRMIQDHPLLGLGPEIPRKQFMEYLPPEIPLPLPDGSYMHLHNIYLHYAAERGIPCVIFLLWLWGKILLDFRRGISRIPSGQSDQHFFLHGGIAVVLALIVEGVADVNMGDSEVLTMFLVIVALGYNALRSQPVAGPAIHAAA